MRDDFIAPLFYLDRQITKIIVEIGFKRRHFTHRGSVLGYPARAVKYFSRFWQIYKSISHFHVFGFRQ